MLWDACNAFVQLTEKQPVNSAEAWRLGAFPLLMQSLEMHKLQSGVVVQCLVAVRCMMQGRQRAGLDFMLSTAEAQQAVRASLAVMQAHPADFCVQSAACTILGTLADTSPQLAVVAAEAGALEAVVLAMRACRNGPVQFSLCVCVALRLLANGAPSHSHQVLAAGGIAVVVDLMSTYPGNVTAQENTAHTLANLCAACPEACAQAVRCGAVKTLCNAVCKHTNVLDVLQYALTALTFLVAKDASAAAAVATAGPAGIGMLSRLLLRSTPAQSDVVLQQACLALASVTVHESEAVSSDDVVLPILHALSVCTHKAPLVARSVCNSLHLVLQSSPTHAAAAAKAGATAAVDAAADAYSADAELQRSAEGIRALLARMEAQSVDAASAREEAERRAAAMADALNAEEEAERAARAAPHAAAARKRSKKKRGGGGGNAADATGAAAADDNVARSLEPDGAAAGAAAALSALALSANAEPTAAAARRRRRAATKAARRLAQRAGGAGDSALAATDDAETEDEADECDTAADAPQEAVQSAAPPLAPQPTEAAAAAAPPPPLMKECCVCMLDMHAAEQMVLVPCGHRCMCEECWRAQLLPRDPAARLCPFCGVPVAAAVRLVANVFDV